MSGFNFSDLQKVAKEAGYDLVPDGEYEAWIDGKVTLKKSGNGKDMWSFAWKIDDGPTKGKVFDQFVLSPDSAPALAFFFRKMTALGLDEEYFAKNPAFEQVAKDMEGRRALITVGKREWQGQDRNQVNAVKKSKLGDEKVASTSAKTNGVPSGLSKAPSNGAPSGLPKAGAKKPEPTPAPEPDGDEAQSQVPVGAAVGDSSDFEEPPF